VKNLVDHIVQLKATKPFEITYQNGVGGTESVRKGTLLDVQVTKMFHDPECGWRFAGIVLVTNRMPPKDHQKGSWVVYWSEFTPFRVLKVAVKKGRKS
jgi:hypothetical protein